MSRMFISKGQSGECLPAVPGPSPSFWERKEGLRLWEQGRAWLCWPTRLGLSRVRRSPLCSSLQPWTSIGNAPRAIPRERPPFSRPAPTCLSATCLETGSPCSATPGLVRGTDALGGPRDSPRFHLEERAPHRGQVSWTPGPSVAADGTSLSSSGLRLSHLYHGAVTFYRPEGQAGVGCGIRILRPVTVGGVGQKGRTKALPGIAKKAEKASRLWDTQGRVPELPACVSFLGHCWCVDREGEYISASLTARSPETPPCKCTPGNAPAGPCGGLRARRGQFTGSAKPPSPRAPA